MKKFLQVSLLCFGLYFVISLPISISNYNNRYSDYKVGTCELYNSTIEPDLLLYKLITNISIDNCTQEIEICCNSYNYWSSFIDNNTTPCHYNHECNMIPDSLLDTNFNLFEISSFIFGVLFALNIIFYCEYKNNVIYLDGYSEIN